VLDAVGVTDTAAEAALVPLALVAVTVQLYSLLLVSFDTEIGLLVAVPVLVVVPVTHEAVYFAMVAPPLELGAVKVMLALTLPAVAAPMVGAPGTVFVGVTNTALEATLLPLALIALTVQLYSLSLVRLDMAIGLLVPVRILVVVPVTHEAV